MKPLKPLKYKPLGYTDHELNQAIHELKNHNSFGKFCDALYNLREVALSRAWHDDVVADERVSLAYTVEARVYQDILNRIADAGAFTGHVEVLDEA